MSATLSPAALVGRNVLVVFNTGQVLGAGGTWTLTAVSDTLLTLQRLVKGLPVETWRLPSANATKITPFPLQEGANSAE